MATDDEGSPARHDPAVHDHRVTVHGAMPRWYESCPRCTSRHPEAERALDEELRTAG